jgi:hypothetical protein
MKKMYSKPQTQTIPMEPVSTLCSSTLVGFGSGKASGPALAPKRPSEF